MAKTGLGVASHESIKKHTKQGGSRPKSASMNKSEKRNFKKYRGQGK
jgi:hypothetical protein